MKHTHFTVAKLKAHYEPHRPLDIGSIRIRTLSIPNNYSVARIGGECKFFSNPESAVAYANSLLKGGGR